MTDRTDSIRPPPLHQRLSDAAKHLGAEPVALAELAAMHGAPAQGSLLVLLATPCVLPVPGIGNVMGVALMLVAVAMWRGESAHALPARVAALVVSAKWARRILELLAGFYRLSGRWSAERLARFASGQPTSWMAIKTGLMGGLIFLPIPLGNVLPALSLVLLGLGLSSRDGAAVLLSTVVAMAALIYTASLGMAAWSWALAPWLGI
jgi:hypothetical protein